ncbi:hypothetical protein ABK040_004632 [Willaertia magna]
MIQIPKTDFVIDDNTDLYPHLETVLSLSVNEKTEILDILEYDKEISEDEQIIVEYSETVLEWNDVLLLKNKIKKRSISVHQGFNNIKPFKNPTIYSKFNFDIHDTVESATAYRKAPSTDDEKIYMIIEPPKYYDENMIIKILDFKLDGRIGYINIPYSRLEGLYLNSFTEYIEEALKTDFKNILLTNSKYSVNINLEKEGTVLRSITSKSTPTEIYCYSSNIPTITIKNKNIEVNNIVFYGDCSTNILLTEKANNAIINNNTFIYTKSAIKITEDNPNDNNLEHFSSKCSNTKLQKKHVSDIKISENYFIADYFTKGDKQPLFTDKRLKNNNLMVSNNVFTVLNDTGKNYYDKISLNLNSVNNLTVLVRISENHFENCPKSILIDNANIYQVPLNNIVIESNFFTILNNTYKGQLINVSPSTKKIKSPIKGLIIDGNTVMYDVYNFYNFSIVNLELNTSNILSKDVNCEFDLTLEKKSTLKTNKVNNLEVNKKETTNKKNRKSKESKKNVKRNNNSNKKALTNTYLSKPNINSIRIVANSDLRGDLFISDNLLFYNIADKSLNIAEVYKVGKDIKGRKVKNLQTIGISLDLQRDKISDENFEILLSNNDFIDSYISLKTKTNIKNCEITPKKNILNTVFNNFHTSIKSNIVCSFSCNSSAVYLLEKDIYVNYNYYGMNTNPSERNILENDKYSTLNHYPLVIFGDNNNIYGNGTLFNKRKYAKKQVCNYNTALFDFEEKSIDSEVNSYNEELKRCFDKCESKFYDPKDSIKCKRENCRLTLDETKCILSDTENLEKDININFVTYRVVKESEETPRPNEDPDEDSDYSDIFIVLFAGLAFIIILLSLPCYFYLLNKATPQKASTKTEHLPYSTTSSFNISSNSDFIESSISSKNQSQVHSDTNKKILAKRKNN